MDASSEAAEQIVRMTLEGTEVALRITGAGAKNAAAMLLAAAASNEKTKGRRGFRRCSNRAVSCACSPSALTI